MSGRPSSLPLAGSALAKSGAHSGLAAEPVAPNKQNEPRFAIDLSGPPLAPATDGPATFGNSDVCGGAFADPTP